MEIGMEVLVCGLNIWSWKSIIPF